MKPTKRSTRPLRFESLERREVMAGNITASVVNGALTLTGDYLGNVLVAYNGAETGQVVIAGGKDYAGGNTQVNGSLAPVTFNGVTSMSADLRGGNNRLLITKMALPADIDSKHRAIYADLGDGNDQVVFSSDTGRSRGFTLNQGGAIPYGSVDITGSVAVIGRGATTP